ncbi:hypothetical protein Tco_1385453 [Tanacetum coccineum]
MKVFTMTMEILPEPTSNKLCDRLILTDSKVNPTTLANDKAIFQRSVIVKEFQERCLIQAFKTKKQQKYEHVGLKVTSTQGGKRLHDDDKRLYLADDHKMTQDHKEVKTK